MSQPTDLELSIFRTLCWFSVFDYPLSTFEIWKWLLRPSRQFDLFEVTLALQKSEWLSVRLQNKDGFWTLKRSSAEQSAKKRHERFCDAMKKYRKLRRACYFFKLFPGVVSVSAANTLAWWHTSKDSDIDLFIITKPNRIWSTRFLIVSPFAFLGKRPTRVTTKKTEDPFCFSFFATNDALQMESLKWDKEDYYFAYWIKSLVPMFDRDEVFEKISTLNRWADVVLPNARPRAGHHYHKTRSIPKLPIQFPFLESMFRSIQRRRFPPRIIALANQDSRVVISDQMLKFHDQDRRAQFMREFEYVNKREIC